MIVDEEEATSIEPTVDGTRGASFVSSTWEMVNAGHSEISWDVDGTHIVVSNAERLAEHLLPRYFRHSQYASWVRALNAYDFKKSGAGRWHHSCFLRGHPELLSLIRRKPPPSRPSRRGAGGSTGGGPALPAPPATSAALMRAPKRPIAPASLHETRQQQLWWMQQELARLQGEVSQIKREEFQQRFDTVRLMQIMLKQGLHLNSLVTPFKPAPQEPSIVWTPAKMLGKMLLEQNGKTPPPLFSLAAATSPGPAAVPVARTAAFAYGPESADGSTALPTATPLASMPSGIAAIGMHAGDGLEDPSDPLGHPSARGLGEFGMPPLRAQPSAESIGSSLPSLPSVNSRTPSYAIASLDLVDGDLVETEALSTSPVYRNVYQEASPFAEESRAIASLASSSSSLGSGVTAAEITGDRMDPEAVHAWAADGGARASGPSSQQQQQQHLSSAGHNNNNNNSSQHLSSAGLMALQSPAALRMASVLAAMPQLPKSTAQLPPEGSLQRQQIEAAIEFAFQQLTISANQGVHGMLEAASPPAASAAIAGASTS